MPGEFEARTWGDGRLSGTPISGGALTDLEVRIGQAIAEVPTQAELDAALETVEKTADLGSSGHAAQYEAAPLSARAFVTTVTDATHYVFNLAALVAAMEATGKAAYFHGGVTWTPRPQDKNTLLNKSDAAFRYIFLGESSTTLALPAGMGSTDFLLRRNRNADGSSVANAYGHHPRLRFSDLKIVGGASPNGSFLDCNRSSISVERVSFSGLLNGIVHDGYNDMKRLVSVYAESMTPGGWVFQQLYEGDGLVVENFMAYACAGLSLKKCRGGSIKGLVSGWHEFIECDLGLSGLHLEGDGVETTNTNPLISCVGSRLRIADGVLYTSQYRPAIQTSDSSGASRRHSSLTVEPEAYFMTRLDDPGSTVGDRVGVAINILNPAKDTDVRLRGVRNRIFKQNATANDLGFDLLAPKVTTGGVTTDEVNLQAAIDVRKSMLGADCQIRYRNSAWEIVGQDPHSHLRTTRRSTSPVGASAAGSNPMTAGWTNLAAGTYYYKVYSRDTENRQTAVSSEISATIDGSNPVPKLTVNAYVAPCVLRILRGTTSGTYTHWAEVVVAREIFELYDQGDAIAGSAWSASGVPTPPTVNTTQDGFVVRGTNGRARIYGTTPPTDGSWNQGDYMENIAPAITGTGGSQYIILGWSCITTGTPGTWQQVRGLTGT